MSVLFEVKNLGRTKWCGEVSVQIDNAEHIEAALLKVAERHLMSRDIDFDGDIDTGKFIVGGFRIVGEYRRKTKGA